MRLTILGCGTSSGVPRIVNDWGACDPADPRNRRSRAAILVATPGSTILVDTGPDLRDQLLAADVGHLDAVIWTHEHADHTHGIDDLRQIFHNRGSPVPGYARADTMDLLLTRFTYVFRGRSGYPPTATVALLPDILTIGDVAVRTVDMAHGNIVTAGLRFEHEGRAIGYATDFATITPAMTELFAGVDLLVVDALRKAPHPTHAHLDMVLDWLPALGARRVLLTHMDQSVDYAALAAELPAGVEPGVDGLTVELT